MGKVATNVKPISQFFTDAKAGKLPQFTYINPEVRIYSTPSETSACAIEGPSVFCSAAASTRCTLLVPSTPERDSLRQSMRLFVALQWNNTLFLLTFDEHGVRSYIMTWDVVGFSKFDRALLTMCLPPLASPILMGSRTLKLLVMARVIPLTLTASVSGVFFDPNIPSSPFIFHRVLC